MRRLLVAWLAFTASGCSCLFDPAKVVVPVATCPETVAGCATASNAAVACDGAGCKYTCAAGFVDGDGDLGKASTNGCECSSAPPANPAELVAVVGKSGIVDFEWPAATPAANSYQLCTGVDAGTCVVLASSSTCDAGRCGYRLGGQTNNGRILGRLSSVSQCAIVGTEATAPVVSLTPIDTESVSSFTVQHNCNPPPTVSAAGPVVSIEQNGSALGCSTVLLMGDELWGDATLEVDVRPSTASIPDYSGLGLQVTTGGGHMVFAGVSTKDVDRPSGLLFRASGTGYPTGGTSSVFAPRPGAFTRLKLVANRGTFSFSAAGDAGMSERIRWPSPSPNAATQTGRPGVAMLMGFNLAAPPGRAEFQNFRLSTSSALPDAGPTSVAFDLQGAALPAGWRLRGPVMAVTRTGCPPFPAASPCTGDAGCGITPDAGCLHLNRGALNGASALFDLPTGIDVTKPWSISMRLAVPDAGSNFPSAVQGNSGSLLHAGNPGWKADTFKLLGQDTTQYLPVATWNHAQWNFNPGGNFSMLLNGQPVTVPNATFPPNGWDRHLGAIQLGFSLGFAGAGNFEGWYTDIRVSQP